MAARKTGVFVGLYEMSDRKFNERKSNNQIN
jgi:hypothetical protein